MRNEELFRQVAEAIETKPELYNQGGWYYMDDDDCGTTCCIAGWAVAISQFNGNTLQAATKYYNSDDFNISVEAREALGLTAAEARDLFHGHWAPHEGLSVPDALRKISEGAEIADISNPAFLTQYHNYDPWVRRVDIDEPLNSL